MRKRVLIISLLAIVVMGGYAQTYDYRVGIKLGPSFNWASSGSTATKNEGVRLGFNAGLVIDRYFTDNISLSSGLNFNFMSMKYQFEDARSEFFLNEVQLPVERRVKATVLEVPLKAKVGLEVMESVRAYVEAGGSLGFNLKDKVKDKYKYFNYSYEDATYVDRTEQYRLLQASIVFGLGAEYQINRNFSVFAQLTFNHSLMNAFSKEVENKTGSILNTNFIGIEMGGVF